MAASSSGSRLRELRESAGVGLEQLARRSGVGRRTLFRWEREGLEPATLLALVRVAWALGIAPSELVPALGRLPPRGGGLLVEAREARRLEAARLAGTGLPGTGGGLESPTG
jgi:transcriptional regulator with XRE-family HTH domain